MGVCTINPIRETLHRAISYITDPSKISSNIEPFLYGLSDLNNAANEILEARKHLTSYQLEKINSLAQHLRQSFKPGEITPQLAQEIGIKLCEEMFGKDFQYIVSTHTDKKHIHNHILVNHINTNTYKALNSNINFYWNFRKISDKLCQEYGLSVIQNTNKINLEKLFKESKMNVSDFLNQKINTSWTMKLQFAIDRAIENANGNYDTFILEMEKLGYEVKDNTKDEQGKRKYIAFKHRNQKKFLRATSKRLGKDYTRESIIERLQNKNYILENTISEETILAKQQSEKPKLKRVISITDRIKESYGLSKWAIGQNRIAISEMLLLLRKLEREGKNFYQYIDDLENRKKEIYEELTQFSTEISFCEKCFKHLDALEKHSLIYEEWDELIDEKSKKNFEIVYKKELNQYLNAQKFLSKHELNGLSFEIISKKLEQLKNKQKNNFDELNDIQAQLKELKQFHKNIDNLNKNPLKKE